MQSITSELKKLNVEVLAISADPPEKLQPTAENFDFPLLGDPENKVIDQFGLRHKGGNPMGSDIARPALILIDGQGNVLFGLLTDDWRVRPTPNNILAKVRKAQKQNNQQ